MVKVRVSVSLIGMRVTSLTTDPNPNHNHTSWGTTRTVVTSAALSNQNRECNRNFLGVPH